METEIEIISNAVTAKIKPMFDELRAERDALAKLNEEMVEIFESIRKHEEYMHYYDAAFRKQQCWILATEALAKASSLKKGE